MTSNWGDMETIVEYMEDYGDGSGTHHILYFCCDSGTFILESAGVLFNDGDLTIEDFDSQEALEWCTEYAGMDPVEAARRIIGADEDTPR